MAIRQQQALARDLANWERMARFHRTVVQEMDRSLRHRFNRSLDDYDVLHQVVVSGDPLRMGELAGRLLLANSSCNRIVGRLVEAGILERFRGEVDRREVLVGATADGRRLHRRMATVHTRDIQRLFAAPLSAAGRRGLEVAFDELSVEGAEGQG